MKLALHQLRHELRRSAFGLALYLLVLVANLALTLQWVGPPTLGARGSWEYSGTLQLLFLFAYWISFAGVVATCVVADSPARRDRFLATRPLPTLALGTAKLLYLVVAVLLPATVVEAVALSSAGADPPTIIAGALERSVLCAVVALAVAAFAAHWPSMPRFLLAAALTAAAASVLGAIVGGLLESFLRKAGRPLPEPTFLTFLQGVAVLAAGLALSARICSRQRTSYSFLVPALAVIAALGVSVMIASPWRTLTIHPTDQAAIDAHLADDPAAVALLTASFEISSDPDHSGGLSAGFTVAPVTTGLPDDLEFRWDARARTVDTAGHLTHDRSGDSHALADREVAPDNMPVSKALAHAIQDHLGTQVIFRLGNHHGSSSPSSLAVDGLNYNSRGDPTVKTLQVSADIVGDAFRWEVAADLPFETGSSARDDVSSWMLAGVLSPSTHEVRLQLSERTLLLHTARESIHRPDRDRWRKNHRFALYLPGGNIVAFGDPQYFRAIPAASASRQYLGDVQFYDSDSSNTPGFTPELLAGARLLILRSRYIGRLTRSWTSPEATLRPYPTTVPSRPNFDPAVDRWQASEFALWFHHEDRLAPEAGSAEVHAHLTRLFDHLALCERSFSNIHEPAARYAARFVPRHLDSFYRLLPEVPFHTLRVLTSALALGAEESQRQDILDHLPQFAELDEVVDLRGWNEDARPHRIALVRQHLRPADRYLPDLLAVPDPALDALALDSYRINPSIAVYKVLRDVPRLANEVERITRSFWQPGRILVERARFRGTLEFALVQGRPEALEELFTVIQALPHEDNQAPWELSQLISRSFHVPPDQRGQNAFDRAYIRWAAQHRPADFHFDPLLRRFVLKSARQTI